jgi:biopolymer transport protein ExbD
VITPPRRSVTRFFIPLIDVLILLFCIFLLMPFVSAPDDVVPTPPPKTPPTDADQLQKQLAEVQRRLDRALKDRAATADKLSVRVLEIDRATGKLYAFEPDAPVPRQEVPDQLAAQRLIDKQRRVAGAKEPFFLILYPRELTGFPLQKQIETYRRWFKDVSLGFDNPWAGS